MASSGRTATTKAMGGGSTQFQHLVQTEVPRKLLVEWLEIWRKHYRLPGAVRVELRPHTAGSDLLELQVTNDKGKTVANIIFANMQDRRGTSFLSVRNQNTFVESFRQKRLMTLVHLFLIHRYKATSVHYVSPTDDVLYQTRRMKHHGIFAEVHSEIGEMIVASVNAPRIAELLEPDRVALKKLINKTGPPSSGR